MKVHSFIFDATLVPSFNSSHHRQQSRGSGSPNGESVSHITYWKSSSKSENPAGDNATLLERLWRSQWIRKCLITIVTISIIREPEQQQIRKRLITIVTISMKISWKSIGHNLFCGCNDTTAWDPKPCHPCDMCPHNYATARPIKDRRSNCCWPSLRPLLLLPRRRCRLLRPRHNTCPRSQPRPSSLGYSGTPTMRCPPGCCRAPWTPADKTWNRYVYTIPNAKSMYICF